MIFFFFILCESFSSDYIIRRLYVACGLPVVGIIFSSYRLEACGECVNRRRREYFACLETNCEYDLQLTQYLFWATYYPVSDCQHILNDFQQTAHFDEFTHHAIQQGQTVFAIILPIFFSRLSHEIIRTRPTWAFINYYWFVRTHFSFFLIVRVCKVHPFAWSSCVQIALQFTCTACTGWSMCTADELFTGFSGWMISRMYVGYQAHHSRKKN